MTTNASRDHCWEKWRKQGGAHFIMVIIDALHKCSVRKLMDVVTNVVQKYPGN